MPVLNKIVSKCLPEYFSLGINIYGSVASFQQDPEKILSSLGDHFMPQKGEILTL